MIRAGSQLALERPDVALHRITCPAVDPRQREAFALASDSCGSVATAADAQQRLRTVQTGEGLRQVAVIEGVAQPRPRAAFELQRRGSDPRGVACGPHVELTSQRAVDRHAELSVRGVGQIASQYDYNQAASIAITNQTTNPGALQGDPVTTSRNGEIVATKLPVFICPSDPTDPFQPAASDFYAIKTGSGLRGARTNYDFSTNCRVDCNFWASLPANQRHLFGENSRTGLADVKVVTTLCPGGKERMRRLLAMVEHGHFDPSPLITHTFPLAEIVAAYELFGSLKDGVMKIAIRP